MALEQLGDLQAVKVTLAEMKTLHEYLVKKKQMGPANAVDADIRVVTAWIDHAEGKDEEALELLRPIARKDHGLFATDGDIPAHEMMGDMLLEMNRPDAALSEYEAELKVSPVGDYLCRRAFDQARTCPCQRICIRPGQEVIGKPM